MHSRQVTFAELNKATVALESSLASKNIKFPVISKVTKPVVPKIISAT